MTGSKYNAHIEPLFTELDIFQASDRLDVQWIKIMVLWY